jgi:hypothetical protein
MGNSFAPPPPLRLSTAGRMLGETELLNALQRGARQAFAFLDGRWGTIPKVWWYRSEIDWRGQRVTFMVDGRAIEATETVIDRPPLEREERRDFVEKLDEKREHDRLTKAVKAALGSATDTPGDPEKKQLFLAWGEEEKKTWGSYPPMQRTKNGRKGVRAWAARNQVGRQTAEDWARDAGWARPPGRQPN